MVFLDHVQNLHIHAEKTHQDYGAHCMNMLILYMVQKTHTAPYYRVLALFMCGVIQVQYGQNALVGPRNRPNWADFDIGPQGSKIEQRILARTA